MDGGVKVPLLREQTEEEEEDYPPVKSVKEAGIVFWKETTKLWKIAAPIVFNIVCLYATFPLTNVFVGHLGDLQLSAVALALSVVDTFAFGFMLGMGSALETLCGQAYGAGQVHMLGIYMQRSWIILLATGVLLSPMYIFAGPILKFLGQEADIAELAGKFTIMIVPQLFALAIDFPTQKFLQAQSKVSIMAWIGFIALVSHAFMLWLFIRVCGWGLIGAAVAFNITQWGISIAQVVYVFGWCKDAWLGFSWAAFEDLWEFVRLSFASALMLCLEVWYIMSITLLASYLTDAVIAVGSLSICTNVNGLQFMVFIGINAAISVRVSNELGLGHARAVKYSVYTTIFQSLLIGLLCMVIILISRDDFAAIFTDSEVLRQAVAKQAWLLGITMVLNSVQPIISGVAIGGGWQGLVAYINLGSYYAFGVPLAFVLGYVLQLGVTGIWGGLIAGTALQTVILLFVIYQTNWNKEVEKTSSRMKKWTGQDVSADEIAP